jgi:pSer/pThr/pTyr-binding forkhead associated (FHA) protein
MASNERHVVLDTFPVIIGRSPEADVYLTDPWISRVHCGLNFVDGHFVLRDLESQNGTWVNRARVTESVLGVDDQINVGVTKIVVLDVEVGERRKRSDFG